MKRYYGLFLTALWAFPLIADEEATHQLSFPAHSRPWFTGPLLAPSGYTVPKGHYSLEPYVFYNAYTGNYNSHWKARSAPHFYSTLLQFRVKIGILQGWDFQFYPQFIYNETQGHRYSNIGDLPLSLNIQLLRSGLEDSWPALKFSLKAHIPLGKYQHLKAHRQRTDALGTGSWNPAAGLVFSKLWNISGIHYLEARVAFNYQIGTPVHVKGISTYGGSSPTRGTAYPGNAFSVDGAIQYNFSQRWVFACDLFYLHSNRNRFSGKTEVNATRPSREQLSLAPALEYNWSDNFGIIGGVWFTVAGRNSRQFTTGVIALSIYL